MKFIRQKKLKDKVITEDDNKNFEKDKFVMKSNKDEIIDGNGYINIIPKKLHNYNIDGFFAAKMIKND